MLFDWWFPGAFQLVVPRCFLIGGSPVLFEWFHNAFRLYFSIGASPVLFDWRLAIASGLVIPHNSPKPLDWWFLCAFRLVVPPYFSIGGSPMLFDWWFPVLFLVSRPAGNYNKAQKLLRLGCGV